VLLWTWSPAPDEMSLLVTPQTESFERGKRSGLPTSRKTGLPGGLCSMNWDAQRVGMGARSDRSL